jgi:chromate transporter
MRDELVRRRRWLSDERFLDLFGAANLIPGPNSTELAIHVGFVRAGWRGLIVAGTCFIVPAALLVLGLAVLYDSYGQTVTGRALLYGIEPVVIAIVAGAIAALLRTAAKDLLTAAVGVSVFALYLLLGQELALLFAGGAVVALARNAARLRVGAVLTPLPLGPALPLAAAASGVGLLGLFLSMLKIGAVLYGSGYVLIAFLHGEYVGPGMLSEQQLVDAVAVGQATPGPVFTTATFVGYLLHGFTGAALATIAIFLPSFVLVAATSPLIPRLRRSPLMAGFLDGVNVAALGLMAGVTLDLAGAAIVDVPTGLLTAAALAVLLLVRPNSVWMIAAGAAFGIAAGILPGFGP